MEEQEWSNSLAEVVVEPFERDIGPTIPITADPTDMFLKFFTPQVIQHITTDTNRYAATCISTYVPSSGPVQDWSTSEEEIRALMGITKLPDLYDYWSTTEALHNFAIASRIPRKRFLEIQRYLHFADNASITPRGQEGYDHRYYSNRDWKRRTCAPSYQYKPPRAIRVTPQQSQIAGLVSLLNE